MSYNSCSVTKFITMQQEVIYEVSLKVNLAIYQKFVEWLDQHVQDIVNLEGFIDACILHPVEESGNDDKLLTVQYHLDSKASLDNYFENYAPKFRADGLEKFPSGFSASRSLWYIKKHVGKSR